MNTGRWKVIAVTATVAVRPLARRVATVPPARSICDRSQPPKMSPCGLASAGIAMARSAGSHCGGAPVVSLAGMIHPWVTCCHGRRNPYRSSGRTMTKSLNGPAIGRPIVRKEDAPLVTGQGRFSDDVNLPGQAYAVMVRSPHAHARIRSIDASAALALPGVIAVLTGADARADGLKPIPHRPYIGPPDIALGKRDVSDKFLSPHHALPHDKSRFTGEAVAIVVAESVAAAKDAAERVMVDFVPLPAVTDTVKAAAVDAPRLWDEAPSNICVDALVGDAAATADAFKRAAHVVKLDTRVQRVTGVPLEPRAAVGGYDSATGRYTLYAGSGGVVRQKHELAAALGVPTERVRVVSGDVGGNFGTRNAFYPEFALVVWAARRVGRPVKWTCERQEAFLSDYQGRDLFVSAELALDRDGNFLALRSTNLSNVGAHTVSFVP